MVDPMEIHEFHQHKTRNTKFCQDSQEDKYSNAWNQMFEAPPQMVHTHLVFNEYDVLMDVIEKLSGTNYIFYALLVEFLNTHQVNSIAPPYGEKYNTDTIYYEMKKHALAFTKEQLSYDTLL
jgi:hypothetical protein